MNQERPGVALVTGATSGIGEAYARCLAEKGYDLVLVARRGELLENLARELSDEHAVSVETLVVDLAREDEIQKLALYVQETKPLSMLVNNAGFALRGKFAKSDIDRQVDMIMVHDVAPARLIHAALPGMIAAGRGVIINVSSIVGLLAWPGGSKTYGGSKAFLVNFSDGLQQEVAGKGIKVQALCPGFVRTGFHETMGEKMSSIPDFLWMTPEKVVDASIKALKKRKTIFIPGARYRLIVLGSRVVPGAFMQRISKMVRKSTRK
ncbi:MAG: SDR family oxidoreductase [Actinobacteria bacterium]|nr:SDR family oxidoreductase [Actinomycetota bacterium]